MKPAINADYPLLDPDEPSPVAVENPDGQAPVLLVCDHAQHRVPRRLQHLGLDPKLLAERHIGWDIGAACVTRRLMARLDAPAVFSSYSRLVIDLNRPPGDPTSILPVSDGVAVPGNEGLSPEEVEWRTEALFWPYHHAVGQCLTRLHQRGPAPALVAIHSFTPEFEGLRRPWQVGVLWNHDPRIAEPLLHWLQRRDDLCVGDNEPYSGRETGFTMEHHAAAAGLPHVCLELRQDLIADEAGCAHWAEVVGEALEAVLSNATLHQVEYH
ncbi:MAG: N-formylglutamate amidohydrolase [Candidatus Competibacterales bacterium]